MAKTDTPRTAQTLDYGVTELSEGKLTLRRLLEERLLRDAQVHADDHEELGKRVVTWCLPWEQALSSETELSDVLVYAQERQLDGDELAAVAARQPACLVIAGDTQWGKQVGGLPTVEVAKHVGFREVGRLVGELVLAHEAHVLRYGVTVHRAMAGLLYRGAGLPALCQQLARLSRCTVAIMDPHRRVLAFASGADPLFDRDAVTAAFSGQPPEAMLESIPPGTSPELDMVTIGETRRTCVISPIVLGGRHDGWVVLIEPDEAPHPHDLAEHRVVVEQAVTIVGTEMLRVRSIDEAEERVRGDFVHALLHGRFATAHDLDARATHHDFPTDGEYSVLVADGFRVSNGESPVAISQLARDATRLVSPQGTRVLAAGVGDIFAVVYRLAPRSACAPARSPTAASQEVADYAGALERQLHERTHSSARVTYGRVVSGATNISASYREARITLDLSERLSLRGVCGFDDLRVFAVLTELASSEQARAFASDLLAPLRSGRTEPAELEGAVLTYVERGGNVNAAARQLHIHRNTMLYKLDRASRALHLDLRQAEHQFALWLAYKLEMLAATTAQVDRDIKPTSPTR